MGKYCIKVTGTPTQTLGDDKEGGFNLLSLFFSFDIESEFSDVFYLKTPIKIFSKKIMLNEISGVIPCR